MDYGVGIDGLTGDIRGSGLKPGELDTIEDAEGQKIWVNVDRIDSMEDLQTSLGIDVKIGLHFGLFNSSAKLNYAESVKFNSESTFLIVRVVVVNPFKQLRSNQLVSQAADLLKNGKTDRFREQFGDLFVRGLVTGGEYFGVIEITSKSTTEQRSIAASLKASYGAFGIGGSIKTDLTDDMKHHLQDSELHITTFQQGGENVGLDNDVEAMMLKASTFAASVKGTFAVPYSALLVDYRSLDLPAGPTFVDIRQAEEVLEDLARWRSQLLIKKNSIESVQLHPEYYSNPDFVTLQKAHDQIVNELNEINRRARRCADRLSGCTFYSPDVPMLNMPRRLESAPTTDPALPLEPVPMDFRIGVVAPHPLADLRNLGLEVHINN